MSSTPAREPLALADGQLSAHFWLAEFTESQTATRRGLSNKPTPAVLDNLRRLAATLERVRDLLQGAPIRISSGYRAPQVNAAVGGSLTSLHLQGCAADFTAPQYGSPLQICQALAADTTLDFQELIFEGAWVHFGIQADPARRRNRSVTTAVFRRGQPTIYVPGLQG